MERVTIRAHGAHIPRAEWSLRDVWRAIDAHLTLRRSRQALLKLDEAHLRDIGLTRATAEAEARRSLLVGD